MLFLPKPVIFVDIFRSGRQQGTQKAGPFRSIKLDIFINRQYSSYHRCS